MTVEQRMIQYDLESYYKNDPTSYNELLFLFDFLEQKMNKLLNNKKFVAACVKNSDKRLGYFRDEVINDFGHPEKLWKLKGPRAKYYRMLLLQVNVILKSLGERQAIARVCENYSWDKTRLADIRQDLVGARLYPTNAELLNILRAGKIPVLPKKNSLVLDFSTEDNLVSLVEDNKIKLRVQNKWIAIDLDPKHKRKNFVKYHRPRLQKIKGKLILSVPYSVEIPENKGTNILGVDLGRKKAFAAVAITPDGDWSRELAPSKETDRLFEKERVLTQELNFLYAKKSRIAGLLTNNDDSTLRDKYDKLHEHSRLVKNKRTRLKKHAAYTTARDITTHADQQDCNIIKVENLSFVSESYGGRWNHAEVIANLRNIAVLEGIVVVEVGAKNTSETDPWEGTPAPANKNREITLRDGTKMDRDYAAALIIGCRRAKFTKRNKSRSAGEIVLRSRNRRDKCVPTPKRAKQVLRKSLYKKIVKNKNVFGVSLTVAPPNRDSNNQLLHSVPQETVENKAVYNKANYSLYNKTAYGWWVVKKSFWSIFLKLCLDPETLKANSLTAEKEINLRNDNFSYEDLFSKVLAFYNVERENEFSLVELFLVMADCLNYFTIILSDSDDIDYALSILGLRTTEKVEVSQRLFFSNNVINKVACMLVENLDYICEFVSVFDEMEE